MEHLTRSQVSFMFSSLMTIVEFHSKVSENQLIYTTKLSTVSAPALAAVNNNNYNLGYEVVT